MGHCCKFLLSNRPNIDPGLHCACHTTCVALSRLINSLFLLLLESGGPLLTSADPQFQDVVLVLVLRVLVCYS